MLVVDFPVPDLLGGRIVALYERFKLLVHRLAQNPRLANVLNEGQDKVTSEWVLRADADENQSCGSF